MLAELSRREKTANIKPDPDLDIYMKVRLHLEKRKLGKKTHVKFLFEFYICNGAKLLLKVHFYYQFCRLHH